MRCAYHVPDIESLPCLDCDAYRCGSFSDRRHHFGDDAGSAELLGAGIPGNHNPSLEHDMSFPATTIVLGRALPRRHQGLAASLVNTFVNYSISIRLGISGTVDSEVNSGGKDLLRGYRGALYTGSVCQAVA